MSAHITRAFQKTALPTTLLVLSAATKLRHRVWASAICLTLILVAFFGSHSADDPAQVPQALIRLLIIGNMILWNAWFGRLALLQAQSASTCLPGVRAAIARALLIGAIATVLLPGMLLVALAGAEPLHALGKPALGALVGLLIMLIPWPLAWLMMIALILAPTFLSLLPRLHPWLQLALDLPVILPALIASTALLVAWRWCSVVRTHEPEEIPRWRRAIVFNHQAGVIESGMARSELDANHWRAQAGWLSPSTRVDIAGPHDPAGAIGACLGGSMGSATPRDAARQFGLIAVLTVAMLIVPLNESLTSLRDAALCGGVISLLASGWILASRLHSQRQRLSGEFSEVALLPGLGSPEAASAALLSRMMRRLGHLMLFVLIALSILAWQRGMPSIHMALTAAMWIGVSAGSLMLCMRALAGRAVDSTWTFAMMTPLIALVTMTMTIGFLRLPADRFAIGMFVAWPMVTFLYLSGARLMLKRFRARPHAFLLD
ncbi:hypothetical protein [Luteimonas sp. 3794]|uniref:hypothetical protein n=1 Tax=Luteimonas sp. 3794 TaxID=2817730 RepID=UPI00285C2676|nr:hypothetical protein [Luteimonas sp. 3794]MDR6993246.1 hypothetical protein [Luteimonas sp. 3794]